MRTIRLVALIVLVAVVPVSGCAARKGKVRLDLSGIPEAYLHSGQVPELDRDWLDGTGPYDPHARCQPSD